MRAAYQAESAVQAEGQRSTSAACRQKDPAVVRPHVTRDCETPRPDPSRNSLVAGHVIPYLEAVHDDGAPGGARWSVVRSAVPCRHTRSRSVGDTRGGADGEESVSGDRCGGGPAALACRATEDGGGGQPGGGREDDPQVRRRDRGGGDPSGRRSGQRPGRVGRAGGGLVPGAGGRAGAQPDLAGAGGPPGADHEDDRDEHPGHGAPAAARRARGGRQRVQPASVCGPGVPGPPISPGRSTVTGRDRRPGTAWPTYRRRLDSLAATPCSSRSRWCTVARVFVSIIFVISSRRPSSSGQVRLRACASTSSGNQPATRAAHPARSLTRPSPGRIPSASAAATYLRIVFTSTPRLAATTVFGRPACQCCRTSTTSIT